MDRSPLQQRAAALKSSTGRTASAAEPGRPDRINNLQARRKSMPKADMCGVKIFPLPLQCRNSAAGLSLLSVTAKPRHCCGRSRRTAYFVLAGFVGMHTAYVTHANWCNPHRLTRHHIGGRLLAEGHSTLSAWSLSDSHIRTVTEHRGSRVHWPRAAAGQLASSFKGLDSRIPHSIPQHTAAKHTYRHKQWHWHARRVRQAQQGGFSGSDTTLVRLCRQCTPLWQLQSHAFLRVHTCGLARGRAGENMHALLQTS